MTGVILLTGGTGFVGRQVLQGLIERGQRTRVVVRDGKQGQLPITDGIESIVATPDLFAEKPDWWSAACEGIDTIIHVAWYAEPGKYIHSVRNLDCLAGTLSLAKGAVQAGVRRFVGIGTCAEYDLAGSQLAADTPLRPTTPYAGAKAATFMALSQWLPRQDVEFAWCRLFYLYGEGEDARRLVPSLRTKLAAGKSVKLTRGNQIRDFLDVREAGRMIAEIAMSGDLGAINVCSGVPMTVRQLAEQIADEYGRRDLLKFGSHPENSFDPPRVVGVKHKLSR